MKAMILAAGRGERMGELTRRIPKPLLEVGGEPLIVRHIRALAAAGVHELVINLSYRGQQIRDALGDGSAWQTGIRYSEEGEPPLETAGGIVHALPLLGDQPFLVVSSDVVCSLDFARLLRSLDNPDPGQWSGTLVMVDNPPHHPDGDFALDAHGRLRDQAPRLTYAGIGLFSPALFTALPAGPLPMRPVLLDAIGRGALHGVHFDGLWLDAGTPERLDSARSAIRRLRREG